MNEKTRGAVRRVVVLGSSISMLTRPAGDGDPYPIVLERALNMRGDDWWIVENLSEVAGTIADAPKHLQRILAAQPDVIVLHYGHVEAIRRPHGRAMWRWTHLHVPGRAPWNDAMRHAGRWYASARRRIGALRQWESPASFSRKLDATIAYLERETNARVLIVEANPWNETIERYGPGTRGKIERCNQALRAIAMRPGASFVSLDHVVACGAFGRSIEELTPDGTHFSGSGHLAMALSLASTIAEAMPAAFPQRPPLRAVEKELAA